MTKKKLGIISSYNSLCGNASYTKALVNQFSRDYDATVISLNVDLLRKGNSKSTKAYIKKICEEIRAYDAVNIQFEAGLFGSEPISIFKHFIPIAKACKNLVLTMHRFHDKESYSTIKSFAKSFLRRKSKKLLKQLRHVYSNNRFASLYFKIVKFCKKNDVPIIVHTFREKELIEMKCKYDKVYNHPLCFFDQTYYESLKTSYSKNDFCKRFSLDENKIYIGIFGFINSYKGHDTLIRALEYLPDHYEALFFGSQHPLSIKINEKIEQYIEELLELISLNNLTKRVKFFGALNDEDFLRALICTDFNVLPYLEVSQGGSAIAALSLESGANSIFSQNLAFLELSKYAPDSFKMFSIGNHLELSNAIFSYHKSSYSANLKTYYSNFNVNTNIALYQKLLFRTETT